MSEALSLGNFNDSDTLMQHLLCSAMLVFICDTATLLKHKTTKRSFKWYIGEYNFLILFFKESSEDVSGGLPFLADLALGLSVLACSMLRILYTGPEVTKEEEACHDLLCSKLLQRYYCRLLHYLISTQHCIFCS